MSVAVAVAVDGTVAGKVTVAVEMSVTVAVTVTVTVTEQRRWQPVAQYCSTANTVRPLSAAPARNQADTAARRPMATTKVGPLATAVVTAGEL